MDPPELVVIETLAGYPWRFEKAPECERECSFNPKGSLTMLPFHDLNGLYTLRIQNKSS